ncbi:YVTN family beta-propeller repeat protein [Streptomyces sp. NPDC002851]
MTHRTPHTSRAPRALQNPPTPLTPLSRRTGVLICGAALTVGALLAGCGSADEQSDQALAKEKQKAPAKPAKPKPLYGLPGMPPVTDPKDIYAADRPNKLSPVVKDFPSRVYVPNTTSNTVDIIDPKKFKVIDTIEVGKHPQHVVPSWDLKTLWVNNNQGNTLTPIDPKTTQRRGPDVEVHDPYNLYFTPNGKSAVVMASLDRELVFRDPHTMKRQHTEPVDCYGVNHADFSFDGRYFIVSCEFSAELLKVDTAKMKVVDQQKLPFKGAMPQDVKVSPDGKTFYIADMMAHGVWVLDGDKFTTPKLMPTGKGAHGLYISRDSKEMYIPNRGEGSISVFDFPKNKLTKKWWLPDGGSPDMGGVSADGKVLWLSGRYDDEVYAIDTATGVQLARIPVGGGPHGLAVYPQPGRYSLGHTGVFR